MKLQVYYHNCDSGLNATPSNQNSAEEAVMRKDLL